VQDELAALGAGDAGVVSVPRFVAISRFTIANGTTDLVRQAFVERPHLVDGAPGFCRMDVFSPVDSANEIWLVTYWTDESSFRVWHRSHEFHASHKGIPRGLKLVPKSAKLEFFEYIAS
jgi:heme-degrading monooxygenase HmoA